MSKAGDMHGGNIHRLRLESGQRDILDFSASINPLGMPKGSRAAVVEAMKNNASLIAHYPDPQCTELRQTIGKHHSIDSRRVLAANGSTELIYLIPRALRPKRVLLTSPIFSEFHRAAQTAGAKVSCLKLRAGDGYAVDSKAFIAAMGWADMAVLCNPNNPTARVLDRNTVLEIAKAAKREKCILVVDEAFVDFCPHESVLGIDSPYLIVLRSLTKFYALAGLRLGFGYFPNKIIAHMQKIREPWSVNTLSQLAGMAALQDAGYASKTLRLIRKERAYLIDELISLGLSPYPSDANYLLLKCSDAATLTQRLLAQGIAVRDCSNFRGLGNNHIRVAVRSRKDNIALLGAMKKVLGEAP